MNMDKKPELLSPAGNKQALIAAVENGADAVYIGGKNFSARQYASNFTDKELKESIEYCHLQGVKVYVVINILLKEEELKEIIDYIIFLYKIGVDAVIIQDLGLLKTLQKYFPEFPIQSSTQMTIHSIEGVELLKKEGFSRAVLARELSLNEIKNIVKKSDIEIKIFNHGALCISYSGQCLMSSIIGGRSGNRGRCAQPCRKYYSLMDLSNRKKPKNLEEGFLLSPKDLNTIEQLHLLIESGVHSFKIEGRMKRPEYVAVVTSIYRKAIDNYYRNKKLNLNKEDLLQLKQIFNRDFTTAYLFTDEKKDIISKDKSNNRGIYLGKIKSINKTQKEMNVELKQSLKIGDGIEVWSNNGENKGMIVNSIKVLGKNVKDARLGQNVILPLLKNGNKGNLIYKTSDIGLMKEAKESYRDLYQRKRELSGAISIKEGSPISLYLEEDNKKDALIIGEKIVERAQDVSLKEKRVKEQLSKLGGTPFELKDLEIQLDDNVNISIKELNDARRKAVEVLKNKMIGLERNIDENSIKEKFEREWSAIHRDNIVPSSNKLAAKVQDIKALKALLETNISEVIFGGDIDFKIEQYEEARNLSMKHNKPIFFAFPRVCREDYMKKLNKYKKELINLLPDGLLLSNYEVINIFKDTEITKEGDFTLNAFNHLSVEKLHEMGLQNISISPELRLREIEKIKEYTDVPLTIFIHGHIEMMISEYCPINCDSKNCSSCKGKGNFGLKDGKGMIFPIYVDPFQRSHILNSRKLCLLENIKDITNVGFEKLRLQFILEDGYEIKETVAAYHSYLESIKKDNTIMPYEAIKFLNKMKEQGLTKGHYFRGVM